MAKAPVIPWDVYQRQRQQPQTFDDPIQRTLSTLNADHARDAVLDGGDPERVARANVLGREVDEHPALIEDSLDDVQRGVNARKMADLAARDPALGKWGQTNPRGMAAASDDHKALGILGGAWDFLKNAPGRVGKAGGLRIAQYATGLYNQFEEAKETILSPFYAAMSEASRTFNAPFLDPQYMLDDAAKRRQRDFVSIKAAADAQAAKYKGANRITEGLLAGTESAPMTALVMLTRDPKLAAGVMGGLTGGNAYQDARAAGKDVGAATIYSLEQGVPEAAFEMAPAAKLLADVAGKLPVGKVVGRYLAEELPSEMATQLFQSYSEWQALHPEKPIDEWVAGLPEEMQQTALGVIGGGTVTAVTVKALQHTADVAGRVSDRYTAAQTAKREQQFFSEAERAAVDSKLRARDPEAYNDLIRAKAEDAGVSHVLVPSEAIRAYQQSDSYDAFDDPFGSFEDQIAEAEATGGDVVLPAEFALGTLPGTAAWSAIKDDLRLSPGGMSAREAQTFDEAMADVVARLSDEMAASDAETRASLSKQEKLIGDIQAKLQDAGFTPNAARSQAELIATRIATRAARMGREVVGNEFDATEVRQVLPPALAEARKADATDLVINALRKGGTAAGGQGPSLLEWIAKRGGVEDRGGDVAAMGGDKWHLRATPEKTKIKKGSRKGQTITLTTIPGRAKLLKPFDEAQGNMLGSSGTNANSLGNLLDAAISEGYFPDLLALRENGEKIDDRVLLDAIGQELAGSPLYAREAAVDPMRAAADELAALLGQRGIDPAGLTDAELRAEIDRLSAQSEGAAYEQEARGRIQFDGPRTVIELFQSRNMSTLIHELGHSWLEELRIDATSEGAPDQLKQDWQTVQDWFAANGHPVTDGVIPTEAHEMWARGTERYLMEGKAPSTALQRLFDTFRGWLIAIYKTVDKLRSPITPEIREVFDRLIATDDEIMRVREAQALEPLFKDAASIGMTGAEYDAYTGLVSEARGEAQGKLLEKTMNTIRRRVTKQWNDDKRALTDEIASVVNAMPIMRALDAMKTMRVSREWIVDNMGVDALSLLPVRVPTVYVEGGVHPDTVAEEAGFGSGREMLDTLIGAERQHREAKAAGDQRTMRGRMIEDRVNSEMARRYGDPFSDGSIEREALAAVNGEMQGEVIAAEIRVLARRSGKRATPYQVARTWARQRIRRGTYATEASPAAIQRHARAVAKAGTEAQDAMLKGDTEAAFAAKQRQMLSSALLAEAKAANDEVEAARKRMDKIARRATSKSIDQDYLDQAHALLEAVDLRERSQRSIDRFGKWSEWAQARAAEGFDIVVPDSFEGMLNTNWSRLPIETLLGLDEAVAQVIHLGRLKQTLLDNKERREFDAVVDEAVRGAGNLQQKPPRGLVEPGWFDRFKAGVANMDAALLKMETVFDWLDGGNSNGVFNRIAFRPIADAQARENDMLADYYGRIKALFSAVDAKTLRRWSEKVTTPFVNRDTGRPEALTRQQVIAMALNVGNEGNLQRLADGYGWNAGAIETFLNETLTAQEWQFVQGVWDTIDTLWPEIEGLEKRVNGIAPEKVEARAFDTPHGPMRGGYYPAVYDSTRDLVAEEHRGKEADLFQGNYTRASTRASSAKARSEQVSRPILLDIGVINRHLGEVIHDITHREAVMQAHKFLTDRRVMAAVDSALGIEIRQQFRPWVKFVANSWAMERAGNEGLGKFFGKLRANATVVGMGFRVTTMLTQAAGYSNSIEVVGGKWIAEAIARVSANPIKSFEFVMERSGEVRHRMDTLDRDVRNAINGLDPLHKLGEVKRFAFHGIGYMDRVVVIPTWIGAYNKALSEGMAEQEAIYAADKAVRLSQGAGSPKDMAAITRGTGKWGELLKIMTMFYSYFSAAYQRERTLGRDMRAASARDMPRLAARAWWLLVVPPLLTELIKASAGSGGPDDDEAWAGWIFKKLLANALGPIPFVRDLFEPAWDKAAGNKSFGYSMSPLQRVGDTFVNVAGDAGRVARGEETKHATKDVLEATGYATGLVPGQLASASQFLVDVGNGDARPQDLSDWIEGLSTGKIKDK